MSRMSQRWGRVILYLPLEVGKCQRPPAGAARELSSLRSQGASMSVGTSPNGSVQSAISILMWLLSHVHTDQINCTIIKFH